MPRLKKAFPKMHRHHKGGAFLKLSGRVIWLGPYGSSKAQEKYDQVIAEWLANGRHLLEEPEEPDEPTKVVEVVDQYAAWVESRYSASEQHTSRAAIRVVNRLYGSTDAIAFGLKRLRAVRAHMVEKGWPGPTSTSRSAASAACSSGPSHASWSPKQSTGASAPWSPCDAVKPGIVRRSSPSPGPTSGWSDTTAPDRSVP